MTETNNLANQSDAHESMGLWGGIALVAAGIGLPIAAQFMFAWIPGLWPTVPLTSLILTSGAMALVVFGAYAVLGALVRRNSADYWILKQSFGSTNAFVISFFMIFFIAVGVGGWISSVGQELLSAFFRISGLFANAVTMTQMADDIASPAYRVIVGTVLISIAFFFSLLSRRLLIGWFKGLLIFMLVIWGILTYLLATFPQSAFVESWDKWVGLGTYLEHLIRAKEMGLTTLASPPLLVGAAATAFFLFFGGFLPTAFAGDMRGSKRAYGSGVLVLLFTMGLLTINATLLLRLAPLQWFAAESFLMRSGFQGITMPWIFFYATLLKGNFIIAFLFQVAWLFAVVALIQAYMLYAVRIMRVWVDENWLPKIFAYEQTTMKSPVLSIFVVAFAMMTGVIAGAFGWGATAQTTLIWSVSIGQLLVMVAMARAAFRPGSIRVPVWAAVLAMLAALILAVALWAMIAYPVVALFSPAVLIVFVASLGVGIAYTYVRRSFLNRQQQKDQPPSPGVTV